MGDKERRISVLLVDDDTDFLDSATRALDRRGFRVYKSSSSEFVRDMLTSIPVDVAVLDLKMPNVDGHELFREFRKHQPEVAVIILTGHGALDDAFDMAKGGVFEYLSKPCEIDDLARTIRKAAESTGRIAKPVEILTNGDEDDDATVRVLVVDDEEDFLQSVAPVLRRRGFLVETVASGEEALGVLARQTVDVAVVDVKMPGMSGLDLLERIKAAKPAVEVVLLTGHATTAAAIQGIKMGAFDFLLKPQDTDELVEKIRGAARRKAEGERKKRENLIDELIRKSPS